MTTPTGTIRMSQIISEFGPNNTTNALPNRTRLGSYRVNQSIGGINWPLDNNVPTSGPISFSQLRGKTANVVIDYPPGATEFSVNSRNKYSSAGSVVGGFRGVPGSTETKKVYHVVRKVLGGGFDSGNWDTNTITLQYLINGGQIYGAGGNGGAGGDGSGNGSPGGGGSPAFIIRYPCDVVNSGYIQGGFGGGGGGGGAFDDPDKNPNDPVNNGGGGGGGAGIPAGAGGRGGCCGAGGGSPGSPGSPGSTFSGGGGGGGGNTRQAGSSRGGPGGNGGPGASDGSSGSGNRGAGSGGSAGGNGAAIVRAGGGLNYSGGGGLVGGVV